MLNKNTVTNLANIRVVAGEQNGILFPKLAHMSWIVSVFLVQDLDSNSERILPWKTQVTLVDIGIAPSTNPLHGHLNEAGINQPGTVR